MAGVKYWDRWLADPSTPDAHVARDAMHADGHITVGDYVLLYATKKEPRSIYDSRTGHSRRIFKEVSTWTWKLRSEVFREVRGSIDECCASLNYGAEPTWDHAGYGLRGLLAAQRARPLFAGLRNQVVDLHTHARPLDVQIVDTPKHAQLIAVTLAHPFSVQVTGQW